MKVGNNGNQLIRVLHYLEVLPASFSIRQLKQIATPYMLNSAHLEREDIVLDAIETAEEIGYIVLL